MNYQAIRLAATEALNNALKDIPQAKRTLLIKLFQENFDDEFAEEMRVANRELELEELQDWKEELEHRRIERSKL